MRCLIQTNEHRRGKGVAILLWPLDAKKPFAFVSTADGAFQIEVNGAPRMLRGPVQDGDYEAGYYHGWLLVTCPDTARAA